MMRWWNNRSRLRSYMKAYGLRPGFFESNEGMSERVRDQIFALPRCHVRLKRPDFRTVR